MKCIRCPVADGPCHGEVNPRLCDLIDPDHPDYTPDYRETITHAAAARTAYPPLARQAANLGRALWDWAVSGFSMATEEEQARRLTICRTCPQWDGGRCRICGCGLAAKVALKTSHCPLPEPRW